MGFKEKLYRQVDAAAWGRKGVSPFNIVICILIVAAVFVAMLETEQTVRQTAPLVFDWLERIFFVVFLTELCARVYVAPLNPAFAGPWGRLRYLFSPWAIIDVLALLPFVLTMGGSTAFYLRLARLLRILRLSRLGRFSKAWTLLWLAVVRRKFELIMSGMVALFLLVISSTLLYVAESPHQPVEFGSIPRAFWWSVATLTTVGYGDVTPVTALGKLFAGLTAITGIGLVAMPTGILAAAFSDAFQENREDNS